MRDFRSLVLTGALLTVLLARAGASGTYPPAPPRMPPEVLKSIDGEQYNLGKALFTGRAMPADTPQGTPAAQADRRSRLQTLQDNLPERVKADTDLPSLAARLSDEEAAAIIYYASRRFQTAPASA